MAGGDQGGGEVKETQAQKIASLKATQMFADYQKRWVPVENWFMQRVTNIEPIRQKEIGRTAAETRAQFGIAGDQLVKNFAQTGVAPGSGRFVEGLAGLSGDQARSSGIGVTATDQAVEDAYVRGLQDIMAMGRGQQAGAFQGFQKIARLSGATAASDAQIAAQQRMATGQVLGYGIGAGLGYGGLGGGSGGINYGSALSSVPGLGPSGYQTGGYGGSQWSEGV